MHVRWRPKVRRQTGRNTFNSKRSFTSSVSWRTQHLKPAKRWLEEIPDLAASFLKQWKIVCSQLATTGQIHACALSLLWWHQSKCWSFVCLARCSLRLFRAVRPCSRCCFKKSRSASLAQSAMSWKRCGT